MSSSRGTFTINGLVYSDTDDPESTSISLTGNAKVNGMLITKGNGEVTGTFVAKYGASAYEWVQKLLIAFPKRRRPRIAPRN